MSALSLPPPVNAHEDNLDAFGSGAAASMNGNGNGAVDVDSIDPEGTGKKSDELKVGMIRPSKEIKAIIDKTAVAVTKSPSPDLLEERIREHQKSDPKFSFLKDGDPFNRYYRYMIELIREEGEEVALSGAAKAALAAGGPGTPGLPDDGGATPGQVVSAAENAGRKQVEEAERLEQLRREQELEEPRTLEFVNELGSVTAMDLDVLRLTALFTARRGKSFLHALSQREGRNIQFDFLRPTHSLFGYFNRTVEAYIKVLTPPEELLAELSLGVEDKWAVLEEAKKRALWDKVRQDKEKKRAEEKEAEKKAFAEIDWNDFAMVQTIEFTERDREIELPPPTTIREIMSLGLRERKMAAQIVEEVADKDEEELNGDGDAMDVEMDMDEEEEEDEETKERKRKEAEEAKRAREVQAKAMGQAGMKIRKDYVPKGLAARPVGKVTMTICPNCKQSIPENEITEHMRIELLDPKWKEQRQLLDQKKTQAAMLLQNADVSASLKQLASARTDLFGSAEDEEARKKQEAEELAARRKKETIIYDGHMASRARTMEQFQNKANLEEQIRSIHSKAGLLPQDQAKTVGPQLGTPGPSMIPPAMAAGASTPGGGVAFSGSVLSAAPSGPSAPSHLQQQQPSYQEQPAFDPSMFSMPPMPPQNGQASVGGIHPSRLAAMGGSPMGAPGSPAGYMGSPGQLAGQVRPHEADGSEGPAAKRPRVEKLAGGQLYPESDWINMHPDPIDISVQLPNVADRPEWKLNGAIITVPGLPLNFTVGTLRDRIAKIVDAPLPIARMKIDYGVKTMSNSSTLASVNLDEGDMLTLSIRDAKKK